MTQHRAPRSSKAPLAALIVAVVTLTGVGLAHAATSDPTTPVVASAPSPSASVPRPGTTPTAHGPSVPAVPQPTPTAHPKTSASPVRPTPSHTSQAVVAVRVKPHAVKPLPPGVCIVGKPCSLKGLVWHKTVGCTKAWLKNMHRTTCPIDPKTGQPFPLVG